MQGLLGGGADWIGVVDELCRDDTRRSIIVMVITTRNTSDSLAMLFASFFGFLVARGVQRWHIYEGLHA